MTLIKRADKGEALTYEELDGNFTHLGGDGTYQFPATDGLVNQVLTTDGQGNLSFQTISLESITGDLKGSVFADDSTKLVDGVEGKIVGPVDANINRGTDAFTLGAGTISIVSGNALNIESANPYDLTVNSGNDAYYYSDFGNTLIDAGEALTLSAVNGININSPVNTVIQGTAGFVGDLTGSVFADDSTLLVDGVNGTINLNNTSITSLVDVDYVSPVAGDVLKWNGTTWASQPESGAAVSASNADLLDGFDSPYFLDYNNFTNTPSLSAVATSNNYNDLDNLPTNVSDFTNDAGYISSVSVNLGYKLQVFTASGTWTVPDNVTSCRVFVIGGGGGGRIGYAGTNGSQGGWVVAYVSGLTPGSTVSIGIGAGGTFQAGAGGTSNFGSYATGTGGQGVNGNPPNNRTGTGSVGAGATLLTRGNNNELTNSFSSNGFPDWLQGNWRGTVRNASSGGGANQSPLNWSLGSTVYPGSGGASNNSSNGSGTYAGVEGTVIIEY